MLAHFPCAPGVTAGLALDPSLGDVLVHLVGDDGLELHTSTQLKFKRGSTHSIIEPSEKRAFPP